MLLCKGGAIKIKQVTWLGLGSNLTLTPSPNPNLNPNPNPNPNPDPKPNPGPKQGRFADDFGPIDPECKTITHSRAYLHHLFKQVRDRVRVRVSKGSG
jgi:hypothetical protein